MPERKKNNCFEKLAIKFIKNDPDMAQQFEDAWLCSECRNGGINAVAYTRCGDSSRAILKIAGEVYGRGHD